MRCFIGIDLGSTTTKAVVIDEDQNVIGRGITNSRSNYDTAATVAKTEALINGRFHLFRQALARTGALNGDLDTFIGQLERDFRAEQYLEQLVDLEETCRRSLETANFGGDAGVKKRWALTRPRRHGRGLPCAACPRRQAQEPTLPRYRLQPVPGDRRGGRCGRDGHALRLPAQPVRTALIIGGGLKTASTRIGSAATFRWRRWSAASSRCPARRASAARSRRRSRACSTPT